MQWGKQPPFGQQIENKQILCLIRHVCHLLFRGINRSTISKKLSCVSISAVVVSSSKDCVIIFVAGTRGGGVGGRLYKNNYAVRGQKWYALILYIYAILHSVLSLSLSLLWHTYYLTLKFFITPFLKNIQPTGWKCERLKHIQPKWCEPKTWFYSTQHWFRVSSAAKWNILIIRCSVFSSFKSMKSWSPKTETR